MGKALRALDRPEKNGFDGLVEGIQLVVSAPFFEPGPQGIE